MIRCGVVMLVLLVVAYCFIIDCLCGLLHCWMFSWLYNAGVCIVCLVWVCVCLIVLFVMCLFSFGLIYYFALGWYCISGLCVLCLFSCLRYGLFEYVLSLFVVFIW